MTAPEIRPETIRIRRGIRLAVVLALLAAAPAAAQGHRVRLFAGAGLQAFARPELQLGRGAGLGGAAAIRANDRLSFETGFFFGRSNRRYTAGDEPVEDVIAEPAYQFRSNRIHLDGTFVLHLGRRQPFQVFLLAGAGLVRRDELREDFVYAEPEPVPEGEEQPVTGIRVPIGNEISLDAVEFAPTAHVGAGFEVYVFDDLSVRAEYRIWSGNEFAWRTQQALIGVNYYR